MNPNPPVPPRFWRFGQFELDASTRELRKNGLRVHIQEQPARILDALLERAGELVTREELRQRLWLTDTFVDFERSLNAAVAKLRQVLGDSAEQPRFVETVARRGYKFVGPVEIIVRLEKEDAIAVTSVVAAENGNPIHKLGLARWVLAATLAAVVLIASAWHFWGGFPTNPPGDDAIRFVVTPPEGTKIHTVSAISPDGRKLAFVGIDASGHRNLWVRELASETALRLDLTQDAMSPFFSPDSKTIGFFAEGKLKLISYSGGPPKILCDQDQAAGGTWNRDNLILFSQRGRLYRIPARGGLATELLRPTAPENETIIDIWPQFLPDGRRFIVLSRSYKGQVFPVRSEILLGSLDSSQRRLLLSNNNRAAITSSGQLLFLQGGNLQSQALDLSQNRLIGEPATIGYDLTITGDEIAVDVKEGMPVWMVAAGFSVSSTGVLVYHSNGTQNGQLAWLNKSGKRLGFVSKPQEYTQISLSPDERWAVVGIKSSKKNRRLQNLWLLEMETQILSPLSQGKGVNADPVWAPDSSRFVYGALEKEGDQIDLIEATLGDRSPRTFYSDGKANKPEAWSPSGRVFLYRRDEQVILSLPVLEDRKPTVLLDTNHLKGRFQFSPDGRWLAYTSNESGQSELYISSFPSMKNMRQVSLNGGTAPLWRKDGKELFYLSPQGQVMAVEVRNSLSLTTGTPKILFHPSFKVRNLGMGPYGVSTNGEKFLVIEKPPSPDVGVQMHIVTRWDASSPNSSP